MELNSVVPWGRNFQEYKEMFLLSEQDLETKILGCGDGPSSFNAELTQLGGNVTSIDPIYQFGKAQIQKRIDETSSIVSEEVRKHHDNFVWKNISSVDMLINTRLSAMRDFLSDYELGQVEDRYRFETLPHLSFEDNCCDLVLSSHFLFLYSAHFDLQFHIEAILEMCRVSKKEVRIFPLLDLKNRPSPFVEPIIKVLQAKNYHCEVVKTDYEFQKGANEMLKIILS